MPVNRYRIIIDTNLWISFLLSNNYGRLDNLIKKNKVIILFSRELLEEFNEVVCRPKFQKYFTQDKVDNLFISISGHSEFIDVISEVTICRDAKDNFLLALAKDGKADYLITGDKDLLVIEKFDGTKIISITEYLQ